MSFHYGDRVIPVTDDEIQAWLELFYSPAKTEQELRRRSYNFCVVVDALLMQSWIAEEKGGDAAFWYGRVNYILEIADLNRLSLDDQYGLLSFSHAAKAHLPAYDNTVQKMRSHLLTRFSEEDVDRYLKGF